MYSYSRESESRTRTCNIRSVIAICRGDNYALVSENSAMSGIGSLIETILHCSHIFSSSTGVSPIVLRAGRYSSCHQTPFIFTLAPVLNMFIVLQARTSPQDFPRSQANANIVEVVNSCSISSNYKCIVSSRDSRLADETSETVVHVHVLCNISAPFEKTSLCDHFRQSGCQPTLVRRLGRSLCSSSNA